MKGEKIWLVVIIHEIFNTNYLSRAKALSASKHVQSISIRYNNHYIVFMYCK